jgi:RNA-directed DNA polymerase
VQDALRLRSEKFGLTLEPTKTKLVEFGRFAQRHAGKRGRNRPETIYFLGLTLYCTQNRKGNFKVGMRTEKSRLRAWCGKSACHVLWEPQAGDRLR